MNITLPLEKMSTEEKLQVMEAIWDDLSRHADELQPPAWHGDVLAAREDAVRRGDQKFEDWAVAREKIEKGIR